MEIENTCSFEREQLFRYFVLSVTKSLFNRYWYVCLSKASFSFNAFHFFLYKYVNIVTFLVSKQLKNYIKHNQIIISNCNFIKFFKNVFKLI